ncbi:hypothetical protein MNBD_ALPHA11-1802 [hydrothermal vent metagenome]|uniref:Uncharacterized protein n=1 Tax=hydrothermal vent metagenome TaxID=652676 RepID=A0A3B0U0A6_9ZZZZ
MARKFICANQWFYKKEAWQDRWTFFELKKLLAVLSMFQKITKINKTPREFQGALGVLIPQTGIFA